MCTCGSLEPFFALQAANSNPDDSNRYCTLPKELEKQLMPFQVWDIVLCVCCWSRTGRVDGFIWCQVPAMHAID